MDRPLISIVIPVFNAENYIQKGIESVLKQTYKNIEIILINDGSTDRSKYILDEFNLKYSNITVFHQDNFGVSFARNRGLDLVKGEFVCFLDSDDWLEDDAIEYLYNQITNENNVISSCDRNFVSISKGDYYIQRQKPSKESEFYIADKALFEIGTEKINLQSACYKLFPTKLINGNNIRFDTEISHGEDGLFVFNTLKHSKGIIFTPEPKWNILKRFGSATNSGYSSKKLTALVAIDKMIYQSKDKYELLERLRVYYVNRTMGIIMDFCTTNHNYHSDEKLLRNALKKYKKTYLSSKVSIKSKVKFSCYYYMSFKKIKFIHMIIK